MQVIDIIHEHLIKQLLILPILRLVLIQFHLSHFLLSSLCLLGGKFVFALLLFLLLLLDCFELVEHVLVVKNSVRELVTEVILVQELLNALSNYWIAKDRVDIWPLVGIYTEHCLK